MVGTDEALEQSVTRVLVSRGDEGIRVMLHPSPLELGVAGDAGWGGVEGPELTARSCDETQAHLGWQGFSGVLSGCLHRAAVLSCGVAGTGTRLGCSGPPFGWLASSGLVPGCMLRLLSCTCLGGDLTLLGVQDLSWQRVEAHIFFRY